MYVWHKRQMSGTLKMGGEKAGDMSFTGERKDWLLFRKSLRQVFDEKNMVWVSKFFNQKTTENAAAPE